MGVLDRVRAIFSRGAVPQLDPTRQDLVVVVRGFDEVEACSVTLARAAAWRPEHQAVLRHHLSLPAGSVADAASVAAQDGYSSGEPSGGPSMVDVVLSRVQVLDALHCSQERSRMAGLAQRLGGSVLGWDALQPAVDPGAPAAR